VSLKLNGHFRHDIINSCQLFIFSISAGIMVYYFVTQFAIVLHVCVDKRRMSESV